MKTTILKPGTLIKYHRPTMNLEEIGFKIGQVYTVESRGNDLVTQSSTGTVIKLVNLGRLTDHTDHFTIYKSETLLPRGRS